MSSSAIQLGLNDGCPDSSRSEARSMAPSGVEWSLGWDALREATGVLDDARRERVEVTNWSMPCRLILPAVDLFGLPVIAVGSVDPWPNRASTKVTFGRVTEGTGLFAEVDDLPGKAEFVVSDGRGGDEERRFSGPLGLATFDCLSDLEDIANAT